MKFKLTMLLVLLITAVTITDAQDESDRKSLMSAVTDLSGFGLSGDKEEKLEEANKNMLQGLFDIADSDKSDDEKKTLFKKAKEDNKDKYLEILGIDGFVDYQKKMKKKLKGYKRTFKLAKWII